MCDHAFSRTERLLGAPTLQKLKGSHIAVFGIGGVGSFTAEALARAGIGHLTLIDADTVCASNLNRQLVALHSTLGRLKTEVMAERIRDINPVAEVFTHPIFYSRETAGAIDLTAFDFIADAIDSVDAKVELIARAKGRGESPASPNRETPIISCMGAGNKLDPTRFEVAPLSRTSVCPLCKVMRRRLKARGVEDVDVVFSREPPQHQHPPGSVSFVPSVAGLIIAGEIVRKLGELR